MHQTLLPGFLIVAVLAALGCSGSNGDGGANSGSEQDLKKDVLLSDSALAAQLKNPPPGLSKAQADSLLQATITPVATTARLKMLNDFIASGLIKSSKAEAYLRLATEMEGLEWGTPRDL